MREGRCISLIAATIVPCIRRTTRSFYVGQATLEETAFRVTKTM